MRRDDIAERLLDFATRIIKMTDAIPKTTAAKHISTQIVHCGTSAGANFEEARATESDKDFVHKLGISLKELRETRYWLKIIEKAELVPADRMGEIIKESDELCKNLEKSIVATKNRTRRKQ